MNNKAPIGIFDSGVGGTSIWKEIHKQLPHEATVYLADSINAPYGNKTKEEILSLCIKNTEHLISLGCKIIIIACNTATTNAITYLRNHYQIPFIGIEPAIKPAALMSKTSSIGILATKGTLSSKLFHETSKALALDVQITEVIGEGLVTLIENGDIDKPQTRVLLRKYLEPMLVANIDYLVLGCSHYPYLIEPLKELLPSKVQVIDSGQAVAKQTQHVLEDKDLLSNAVTKPKLEFFTNSNIKTLRSLLVEYKDSIDVSEKTF
ncbi:MAG: glutamate racemase [Patiriisocius sp.]|jgi:glutamate racemase|tara:strand:- start:1086 stop:1877 length:792 start_codon:yes stop_codon:yes gene_type:complete